jgi:transposase
MSNLINSNACGIDISAKEHVVAVPKDRDHQPVRTFSSYTQDLHRLANWLHSCGIETVVMESTGVYWYHLYTVLLDYGFEVLLVNAYHVKNVPGRKSDVSDAQWLQQLHSSGMLTGCFQPDNLTRCLRETVRMRKTLIRDMSTQIQRAQKALELMNIKLNRVMRDITGKSGSAMIEAILSGERSPEVLLQHADARLKASREEILMALEGNWRVDQLFNLKLAWEHYQFLQKQLKTCDHQAKETLSQFDPSSEHSSMIRQKGKAKNQPDFDVKQNLYEVLGTDVMAIDGIKATVALTVFSETGPHLRQKFATEKQFLSWLNLVPDNKITGGKIIYSKVKRKKNRAGQAFREAANALWNSTSPLAHYLKRKKAKSGANKAIIATARKLASIYYKMVTEKIAFDREVLRQKNENQLIRNVLYLQKRLEAAKIQLPDNVDFTKLVI